MIRCVVSMAIALGCFSFSSVSRGGSTSQPSSRPTTRPKRTTPQPTTKPAKKNPPQQRAGTTKPPPRTLQLYFPLKVGFSWTYNLRFNSPKSTKITTRITQRKTKDSFVDNFKKTITYDSYGVRYDKRTYRLKYPLNKGTEWLTVKDITSVFRTKIVSINGTIKVPAGTFKSCIVTESTERVSPTKQTLRVEYFAPNVGPVYSSSYIVVKKKKKLQWSFSLVKYQRK